MGLNEEIINNRYMLFVGAGASAALGLKPTAPFLELLPAKLDPLIQQGFKKKFGEQGVRNFLTPFFKQAAQHYKVTLPDSEIVLDYIDFLSEVHSELSSLPDAFGELAATGAITSLHKNWVNMFSKFRGYIQKVVVEHYSRVDGEHAWRIYKPLLESLCAEGQILPVFTTNYDWVFEQFAEVNEASLHLKDGFKGSTMGERWAREVFDNFHPRQTKINLALFKLHGSTSWYRDVGSPGYIRKFPHPAPDLAGSSAVLIYPTQVKAQAIQEEPFKTAYGYLRETMLHTKLVVIIGFSFRDPAINDTLRYALTKNRKLKLAVVEPRMNEEPGIALNELLQKLGIEERVRKARLHVIKGELGDEPFVWEQVARTVQKLDQWDELEPWIQKVTT